MEVESAFAALFGFSPFSDKGHYKMVNGEPVPFTHDEELELQRAYWNRPEVIAAWGGENGGLTPEDHHAVITALESSGFYDELGSDPISLLDLAVGAYSYVDATRLPPGSRMYAVDLSEGKIQRLKAKDPNRYVAYLVGDATALPPEVGESTFNRTLTPFLMRYLVKEAQLAATLEMVRVTAIGGRIDIIDFNKYDFESEISRFSPWALQNAMETPLIQDRLAQLGKSVDFTCREIARRPKEIRLNQVTMRVSKAV